MIIRTNVADIRSIGRSTQGVRVINIDENDLVVAAVKLVDKDDGEEDLPTDEIESADSESPDDDTIH
jgi:DNA gyrase subunit A